MSNAARNTWVTAAALSIALNMSYMAEQLALFGIVVSVALLLSGIGFIVLALGGALRSRESPAVAASTTKRRTAAAAVVSDPPISPSARPHALNLQLRDQLTEEFVRLTLRDLVFASSRGRPSMRGRDGAGAEGGGVSSIGLHEARHTYASLLFAAGVNVKALSTHMSHASITITTTAAGDCCWGRTRKRRRGCSTRTSTARREVG